tara:strand:- start:3044 stop:3616 length:573 start_codon:yes stop_codon:yes gene_type:complete
MGKENDLNVNFFKVDSVFTCPSDADVKSPSPFGPSVPAKDNTIACKLLYRKTLVLEWAQIINIFMLQHLRTKVEVQLCDTADVTLVSKSDFFGAGEEVAKKTPSKKLRALPRIAQSLKPLLPSFHQKQSNPRRSAARPLSGTRSRGVRRVRAARGLGVFRVAGWRTLGGCNGDRLVREHGGGGRGPRATN